MRRTSAAPLTYWAWPPMREGFCWSEDMVFERLFGAGLVFWFWVLVGVGVICWCWKGFW